MPPQRTGSKRAFSYVIPFTTAIAAAGTGQSQVKIDADSVFIITGFNGALTLATSQTYTFGGTTITLPQGMSIPREPGNMTGLSVATNSINLFPLPSFDAFSVAFTTNDYVWQSQAMPLSAVCGDARMRAPGFVFPITRPGDTIFAQLTNNTGGNGALSVIGAITLTGYKDYDVEKYKPGALRR